MSKLGLCCHALILLLLAATEWQLNRQMVASIQLSRFCVSLVLLPGLWYRCNCLVEKQSAVDSLVFT